MRFNSLASKMRLIAAGAALAALAACLPVSGVGIDVLYVEEAPPPPRVEVVPVQPGVEFIWIDGYWSWSSRAYLWVPGRWEHAPHPRAHWVPGRWRHHGHGWYWAPGHWR